MGITQGELVKALSTGGAESSQVNLMSAKARLTVLAQDICHVVPITWRQPDRLPVPGRGTHIEWQHAESVRKKNDSFWYPEGGVLDT